MSNPKPETRNSKLAIRNLLLFAILLLAAFLRLYRLDEIPPGLTHDEADTGHFVVAVHRGEPSQVDTPYGYANEAFTMYSGALFMALFGPNDLALRLHSAFFGLLMILFSYLWARRAFDTPTALGAAVLTAVSFWPIASSRFALNPQPAPALFAGAMWFLWIGLFDDEPDRARWWAWPLFGLFLAGSLWAYEVARATTAAVVAFGGFILLTDPIRARRRGLWFIGGLGIGLALAAPHLFDPRAWQRSATLATTLDGLKAGDPYPLLLTTIEALGTFTFRGDPFITYNIPDRPIFDLPIGILFYGGLLLCLWRWRRPACAFTLLWIGAGLLPSMIVGAWNSTLHSMGMQSVVFVPPILFVVEIARRLERRHTRLLGLVVAGLVALTGVLTFRDYFSHWGERPEVRAAYFHNLTAVTDYLNETGYSGDVTLSSPFPDLPLDPFIADMRVHRDDLRLHWCDGRRAILFPDASSGILILPTNTPLDPILAERLDLRLAERVHLHSDDVDPYFDVFEWNSNDALANFLPRSIDTVTVGDESLRLPVNLGGAVELVAYDLATPTIAPGGTVTLVTIWRILDPTALGPPSAGEYGYAAVLFAHVLDATNAVVGQEDRLDAPAWNWHSGDTFVQLHRFQVDADAQPGSYLLEVGIYTRADLTRLSVVADGIEIDNRILLQPLEVVNQ